MYAMTFHEGKPISSANRTVPGSQDVAYTRAMTEPACVFDAYGTLFDLASVVERSSARLGPAKESVLGLWRRKQLESSWLRSLMGCYEPFDRVTADALSFALASHGIEDPALERDLTASYLEVGPYPDARPALERLGGERVRCFILSNGTRRMVERAVAAAGLDGFFEAILSVDDVSCYKPDPRVYALAEAATGLRPATISFVSGNAWDQSGAASYGLSVVRLVRDASPPEPLPGPPTRTIRSLVDL